MTTDHDNATTLCGVIATATQSAGRSADLAIAASQVVAKRMALGVNAALLPMHADYAEFGRIVPEKLHAFSSAGMIAMTRSGAASHHLTRLASHEVVTTARATVAMAGCATPAALADVQMQFVFAWFRRAATNLMALGELALKAQDAAMAPIHQTVAANAERLAV